MYLGLICSVKKTSRREIRCKWNLKAEHSLYEICPNTKRTILKAIDLFHFQAKRLTSQHEAGCCQATSSTSKLSLMIQNGGTWKSTAPDQECSLFQITPLSYLIEYMPEIQIAFHVCFASWAGIVTVTLLEYTCTDQNMHKTWIHLC